MPDRNYTILKGKNGLYRRIEFGETSVANGDTITLGGFHVTTALTSVKAISKVDGSTVTVAGVGATNVAQFTVGGETPCYYMVYGVKA